MPHELLDLAIDEVSAVDAAANRRTWLVIKRAEPVSPSVQKDDGEPDDAPPLTTMQRLQQSQLREQWFPLWRAFQDSVYACMECDVDDPRAGPLLVQSIDEFATAAKAILSGLGLLTKAMPLYTLQTDLAADVTKVGAALSAARRAKIQDVITLLQTLVDEAMPTTMTEKGARSMADKSTVEELSTQVVTLTKRAIDAEARVTALEAELALAKTSEPDPEAIWKGVAPAIRARLEKAEASAARERELREKQDYIKQASSFQHLPINADDDWEVFKALGDLPSATETVTKARTQDAGIIEAALVRATKSRDRIIQLLKAADEGMRAGKVFGEIGTTGTGVSRGPAAERLTKAAQDKAAASQGALTFEQAFDKVSSEQPALFAEMRAEQAQARR